MISGSITGSLIYPLSGVSSLSLLPRICIGEMSKKRSGTSGNTFLVRPSEKPRKSGNPPLPLEGEKMGVRGNLISLLRSH